MRVPWKLVGLAGVAGVAASGAVVVRRRRGQQEYEPEVLRGKLHERLEQTREAGGSANLPRSSPLGAEDGARFEQPGGEAG